MTALHTASNFQPLLGNMHDELRLQTRYNNAQQSRLLKLPQELRDHIVRVSLPESIDIDPYGVSKETETPAWLQVCSQMRLDAAKVYFGTPIQLPYLSDEKFKAWIDSIDINYRNFVRSIRIDRFFEIPDAAMEFARKQDITGSFRPGTVWVITRVVEDGTARDMWINARGEAKPCLPLYTGVGAGVGFAECDMPLDLFWD